ncbi:MAG: tripartite tricarboxylate transporter substrate binding protein [Ramlibacter sp.]|nr:tripartite tricarboxylate transporter substrate binding protein [Ramlibacter sp.]
MHKQLRRSILRALVGFAFALPLFALAQGYPSRPIAMVIPSAAGGGSDAVARVLGTHLTAVFGQPITMENKLGAGGAIAAAAVSHTAPDGYTLLMGSNATHGANPSLFKNLPYDPVRDFTPVALVGSFLFAVVVHPDVPARTMKELVAYAKANPGKLSYAGVSSTSIVMTETLLRGTGIDILQVPYKSAALALPDIMSGRVSMAVMDLATAGQFVQQGKMRALAITSRERSAVFPEIPTIAETVLPGFEIESWIGLFAPAGTPQPIVDRLNAEVRVILAKPEVKTRLGALAFDVRSASVKEFQELVPREIDKFRKLVKAAGIEAQ